MPARTTPIARGTGLTRRAAPTHRITVQLAESRRVYAAARVVVFARAAGRCELCGGTGPDQTHHRKARQAGGSSRTPAIQSPANLLAVCGWCHDMAERHEDRWDFGWKVHRGHNPGAVPVLVVLGGWESEPEWVLLDDDGGRTPCDGPETGGAA